MKSKPVLCVMFIVFCLSACTKENPLTKYPPEELAQYIFDQKKIWLTECPEVWSYPETTNKTVLERCNSNATKVANLLNEGGFGPNTSSTDIQIPEIWLHYSILIKESHEKAKMSLPNAYGWKEKR